MIYKARVAFEAAESKVKQLNEKAKVNVSKVVEAEQERDATKENLTVVEQESIKSLSQVNNRMEFEVLARMVSYIETYYEYYEKIFFRMQQMLPELEEYRTHVEQQMIEFEKTTGNPVERILQPKSTRKPRGISFSSPKSLSSTSMDNSSNSLLDLEDEGK